MIVTAKPTIEELTQTVIAIRRVNPAFQFDAETMTKIYDAAIRRAQGRQEELGHKGRSWSGR